MTSDKQEKIDNQPHPDDHPEPPFWKSRFGVSLIVSLAIAGLLLGFEHRIHIFAGNGLLVLLLLACGAMHLFMHGGHGGGNKS